MSERLVKQFKKLQKIEPDQEWSKMTRNFLVSKINNETFGREQSWFVDFRFNSVLWIKKAMPSPSKMVALLIIFSLVSGTGMVAQAEYIPQKPLYKVKRTFEKIELVLAVSPEQEAKVHLKHATKRKDEVKKITEKTELNTEVKSEAIKTVVKSLEKDIAAAQSSMEIVKQEETKKVKAVEIAKEITNNVKEAVEVLDEVKVKASTSAEKKDKEAAKTVEEVQENIEKAEDKSIEVLIEEVLLNKDKEVKETESKNQDTEQVEVAAQVEKPDPSEVITEEEVKDIIIKKIERADKKIKEVEEGIKKVKDNEEALSQTSKTGETTDSVSADEALKIDLEEVSDVAGEPAKAQGALEEAKSLIEEGQLSEALNKVKESNEITQVSKKVIAKIEEASEVKVKVNLEDVKEIDNSPIDVKVDIETTTVDILPEVIKEIENNLENQDFTVQSDMEEIEDSEFELTDPVEPDSQFKATGTVETEIIEVKETEDLEETEDSESDK